MRMPVRDTATERIRLGMGALQLGMQVAIAFARAPYVTAMAAWRIRV